MTARTWPAREESQGLLSLPWSTASSNEQSLRPYFAQVNRKPQCPGRAPRYVSAAAASVVRGARGLGFPVLGHRLLHGEDVAADDPGFPELHDRVAGRRRKRPARRDDQHRALEPGFP